MAKMKFIDWLKLGLSKGDDVAKIIDDTCAALDKIDSSDPLVIAKAMKQPFIEMLELAKDFTNDSTDEKIEKILVYLEAIPE